MDEQIETQKIKLAEKQQIQKLEDIAYQEYNPNDIFKTKNIEQIIYSIKRKYQ